MSKHVDDRGMAGCRSEPAVTRAAMAGMSLSDYLLAEIKEMPPQVSVGTQYHIRNTISETGIDYGKIS